LALSVCSFEEETLPAHTDRAEYAAGILLARACLAFADQYGLNEPL